VWKLSPGGHTAHRITALPADGLPNGLAIDPSGRTLYVADSLKGTIWAVPSTGGRAIEWLTDQALAPVPTASQPFGANGLRFHRGAVWVSNFNAGTLMRVPVTDSGVPGPLHQVTAGAVGMDDFSFLTDRSDVVLAAVNAANQVAVVYPNGTRKTVLTAADGLASPTATAVHGTTLYITDAGAQEPHHSQVQSARINLAALRRGTDS
jgi:sugar lactone lactonase YvrE